MMSQMINISIAGVSGVMVGIFLLYLSVRVMCWCCDKIEKKEKREKK